MPFALAKEAAMLIHVQKALFPWECLEDQPTLTTLTTLLASIPDARLIAGLEAARGKGRDDYPVRVLWGVVVLTIALRHQSFEACLGELGRNPTLAKLIGIESEEGIPKAWNISRFLKTLGKKEHRNELEVAFNGMVQRLGQVVPNLGRHTAADATSLSARRTRADAKAKREAEKKEAEKAAKAPGTSVAGAGCPEVPKDDSAPASKARQIALNAKGEKTAEDPKDEKAKIEYDEDGLPLPSGGRKEYKDDVGHVTHVLEWFGFKLHLLVDVKNEVILAYRISSAKAGDNEVLPELVDQGEANLPPDRIETLAYDKAADDIKVHEKLQACDIHPVIQIRAQWKDDKERMLPGHDGNSNIVYDEAGTLYCYDRTSNPMIRRRMAYIGHEKSRGTLKYRCPAMHDDIPCAMSSICNAGKKYGLTIRVKQEIDLRRFPPIPRATKQFERLYKGRTSVERVNARVKIFWGADDGNITGGARFFALVGTVMVVHQAFATVLAMLPRVDASKGKGTLGRMKLGPIAKALRAKIREKDPQAKLPDWLEMPKSTQA
jgi:hypothetical protein